MGCWGHAFGLLYINVKDQGSAVGMLLGCLGGLESLEVLGGTLGSFGCLLGGPWVPWRPWERPGIVLGGPWGDFGGLGRSSDQSWEVRMLILRWF